VLRPYRGFYGPTKTNPAENKKRKWKMPGFPTPTNVAAANAKR